MQSKYRFVLLAFAGLAAIGGSAAAQTSMSPAKSIWDGVYSDAQATRGSTVYFQNCGMCHGATLGGNGEAPPLVGRFMADWQDTTLDQLFDKIAVTMPLSHPGSLGPAANADVLAFILKANHLPAGSADLPASGLSAIRFDVIKPVPAPAAGTRKP
jgi:mono/diheme cytochrome c family protein